MMRTNVRSLILALVVAASAMLGGCGLRGTSPAPAAIPVRPNVVQIGGVIPFRKFALPGAHILDEVIANSRVWFADRVGSVGYAKPGSGQIVDFSLHGGRTPFFIAAGPDGNMWFTEDFDNKIGTITQSGQITEYNVPTIGSQPDGIVAGPDGALWFTENLAAKLGRVDTRGNFTEYSLPSGIDRPADLTVGADHNLWICTQSSFILRVTTSGSMTAFGSPGKFCSSPMLASDGRVYATTFTPYKGLVAIDTTGNAQQIIGFGCNGLHEVSGILYCLEFSKAIQRFDIASQKWLTSVPIPNWFIQNRNMDGLTLGPDGNLWFGLQDNIAVYLLRLITVTPTKLTLPVGQMQSLQASEANFNGTLMAFSQNTSIATVKNGQGAGSFIVTGVSAGSTNLVITDGHYNSFQVSVTVH